MQLVALVHSLDHVCCRYRLAAFRAALADAGHSLLLRPLPRRWWERCSLMRDLRGASVILQRFLLPSWQLVLLRRAVRNLFFDFDDAVFLRDSFSSKRMYHAGKVRRFAATVRASDAVLAGNDFLSEFAARWTARDRIHLLPTCVDPSLYQPRMFPGSGNELVWIGSTSTLRGLNFAQGLMEDLGNKHPGLTLKVICDRYPKFPNLAVKACRWNPATEAQDLAASDIGISWLPNDAWSRGKCGLKILQYMAAGLPVIANPVGVHAELVRHGETGYLASTAQQWHQAVARLRSDPALRMRMGQAGRWRFESCYGVDVGARAWLDLLGRLEGTLVRAG